MAGTKTLVYSPEIRVVIEDTDVTADIVSGNVSRVTGGASSVKITLSNKGLRYNGKFRRMDRIIIWMKRVKWIKVFTGYLNRVPGLQLYPTTVTITASCTIKRLLYMYWDPALPESLKLLNQFGLQSQFGKQGASSSGGAAPDPAGAPTDDIALGDAPPTVTDAPQTLEDLLMPDVGDDTAGRTSPATGDQPPPPEQPDPNSALGQKDAGLGQMLQNILVKVGGWDPADIDIMEFPESFLGYIQERMPEIENLDENAVKAFKELFEFDEPTGAASAGGGGGGGLGDATFTTIGPPANGTNYNMDELVWIAKNAGWTGEDIPTGAAIMQAESGGDPGAVNSANSDGSVDRGLWQINSIHDGRYPGESRFDPAVSTKLARDIYRDAGNSWTPWSTYSYHGTYAQHMDAARAAAARGGTPPPNSGAPTGGSAPAPAPASAPKQPGTGTAAPGSDPNAPNTAGMSIQDSMVAVIKYRFPGPNDGGVFTITSRSRSEPGSYHDFSQNKAIDISNGGTGGTPEMKALAQWIYDNYFGKGILELIHSPFNHNVGDDQDVGDGMSQYYNPATMSDHRDHVHWAMSRVVAADGTTMPDVGGGGGAGSGGSQSTFQNRLAKNIFTYMFDASGYNSQMALQLQGRYAALNDEPLIKIVRALCEAGMREFQSTPDGRFLAFYPDYFGLDGTAPKLKLEDVEMKDVRIDINDDALTTHIFTMGAMTITGDMSQTGDLGYTRSPGVVTVEDEWLFKRATEGSYFPAETTNAEELLGRYGVRPLKKQYPNIYQEANKEAMLLVAIKLFMQKWAEQYETQVELTFMPELFPGMRVELVGHDLIVYVKAVNHSFNFTSGFTTSATVMAPMSVSRSPIGTVASGVPATTGGQ